jgi:hypothetical protein
MQRTCNPPTLNTLLLKLCCRFGLPVCFVWNLGGYGLVVQTLHSRCRSWQSLPCKPITVLRSKQPSGSSTKRLPSGGCFSSCSLPDVQSVSQTAAVAAAVTHSGLEGGHHEPDLAIPIDISAGDWALNVGLLIAMC